MTKDQVIREVRFNMSTIGISDEAAQRVTEARELAVKAIEDQEQAAINAIDEFANELSLRLTDAIYPKDVESMTNLITTVAREMKDKRKQEERSACQIIQSITT